MADKTRSSATAARPAAPISPARRAAFAVLERVAATDAHSDDLLHGPLLAGMSEPDRNLTTALVLATLRWQIALDARIAPLLVRPEAEMALPLRLALRLGAAQLLHFDRIPRHAAINESVELARAGGQEHASGMVNAVLRKLAALPQPGRKLREPVPAFAERLGHPAWLAQRWAAQYGAAAALRTCEYDQAEPAAPHLFPEEVPAMPWMDDGSRLVAELAAAAVSAPKSIWDCCAAPGGKTVVLGRRHPGAEVLATDISERRLRALRARLERELPGARVEQADATEAPADFGEFDLILCDVPCSGTGTLARNPEIRHRLQPADLSRQAARQKSILAGALRRLAPGGRLLYSTCSLEPEENEGVLTAVLRGAGGIERADLRETAARLPVKVDELLTNGCLRTLPGANFAGDGFFAALLQRRG